MKNGGCATIRKFVHYRDLVMITGTTSYFSHLPFYLLLDHLAAPAVLVFSISTCTWALAL